MHVFMTNPGLATCTRPPLPDGPADLNYSSFVVVFGGHGGILTLTRMVTKGVRGHREVRCHRRGAEARRGDHHADGLGVQGVHGDQDVHGGF